MFWKMLLSVVVLGALITPAQAQTETADTARVETLAVPIAPIQAKPKMTAEEFTLEVMCQSAYETEAIARCIAAQGPKAAAQ